MRGATHKKETGPLKWLSEKVPLAEMGTLVIQQRTEFCQQPERNLEADSLSARQDLSLVITLVLVL